MPHVIVKLYPGKSDQQKMALAECIARAVMSTPNYGEESVSVGFEDEEARNWMEQLYWPDIVGKPDKIYKKPGYDPL